MDSFLFALNAVLPIIIMVAIGYLLKKIGFINSDLAKSLNKLVFRIFLPAMLFLNVYNIAAISELNLTYVAYAITAVAVIFFIAIPLVMLLTPDSRRRGSLLQATFRSNYALIGIPLAASLYGDPGVAVAALLSAFSIPVFNVLAVVSLSLFRDGGERPSVKKILIGIAKNPLIGAVLCGVLVLGVRALFVEWHIGFRLSDITPLMKVLGYLSDLATPIALIVLGAQFEFSAISSMKREIIVGTAVRTVAVPLFGLGIAYIIFGNVFGGAEFAALVALFATPVAVSSVPMAQEMDADATLSGQLVVWTTVVSSVTVFLSTLILDLLNVFS